jgi:hypothetical protein
MRRSIQSGLVVVLGAAVINISACASDSGRGGNGAPTASRLSELAPPPDFDRSDPDAVRRAIESDLQSLENAGILIGLVDSTAGRVRVLIEDLTPAKKELLQQRYGRLLDVESGKVRPAN